MYSFKHRQLVTGASLIELLITIWIGVILGVIAYQLLKNSIRINSNVNKDYQQNYQSLRLRSLTENIAQDVNSHPLPIMPKVFKNGIISLHNQLINLELNSTKAPLQNSDMISYLEIDYNNIITLEVSDELKIEGCSPKTIDQETHSYLGVDLEGVSYFQGTALIKTKKCYQFNLSQKPNLIIPKRPPRIRMFTKILIPILSEYLVYKDLEHTLRYISLTGLQIKENQPIFDDAPDLHFSLIPNQQIWQLDLKWKFPFDFNSKQYQQINIFRIARQPVGNIILNL